MSETIIKIEHVSKEYRLGAIGGGTLKGDLQSLAARIRGKEDPNARIGQSAYARNQRFLALDDVSFSVKKGERVGIIGHNGAGKSTLLKLLSRVTAPTKGTISYNGRIASMLEVGTGFHPELTGRENIYLNGAILGMTKAEITRKFDDIVRFAEMEKFVDTPVKRYSSGMYVKLAFAVAAHLDSDILVMDEVLAVGDMKFQQKCLGKMDDVSKNEGKTVLYVSHNMNTIRQLCTRCVVLDHGKVIFDGNVEEAIAVYMDCGNTMTPDAELQDVKRSDYLGQNLKCKMLRAQITSHPDGRVYNSEKVNIRVRWESYQKLQGVQLRIEFRLNGQAVATSFSRERMDCNAGDCLTMETEVDSSLLTVGIYETTFVLFIRNDGYSMDLDCVRAVSFEKIQNDENTITWNTSHWGGVRLPDMPITICERT